MSDDTLTPAAIWWQRYHDATSEPPDSSGYRRPRVDRWSRESIFIWHELLAIVANSPTRGYRREPNPYYRDPLDEHVIREGELELLDKLGKLFAIGPFPRTPATTAATKRTTKKAPVAM
jgi:hypothetical protein